MVRDAKARGAGPLLLLPPGWEDAELQMAKEERMVLGKHKETTTNFNLPFLPHPLQDVEDQQQSCPNGERCQPNAISLKRFKSGEWTGAKHGCRGQMHNALGLAGALSKHQQAALGHFISLCFETRTSAQPEALVGG